MLRRGDVVLRWGAAALILGLSAVLRFWALGRPGVLVFDELYYVRDAVSQLAHGYPTVWPDRSPEFGGERALAFTDEPAAIAHPPLGKWLIALGLLLFGPDTGWGWRFAVAFAGVATVAATMRLGWLMTRSWWVACLAGLLLAVDGVHVVLSRVALLDGLLTLFVLLGAICVWRDGARDGVGGSAIWRRPWLVAAGVAFGAAAAVKWSGLYPLAGFLILITVRDLVRGRRGALDRAGEPADDPRVGPASSIAWGFAIHRALAAAVIALPTAAISYLASWIGWIVTADERGDSPWWSALWHWHAYSLSWHSSLQTEHPYQSNPLTWPLALRPTAMYSQHSDGLVAVVTPVPNPLVTWGGVVALALLLWVLGRAAGSALRQRSLGPLRSSSIWVTAFVLTGYLSGWLPWVLTLSRNAVFQFYAVVLTPFAALALALLLAAIASAPPGRERLLLRAGISLRRSAQSVQSRRLSVAVFIGVTVVLGVLFWPLWSALPVQDWFYQAHRWLPGW